MSDTSARPYFKYYFRTLTNNLAAVSYTRHTAAGSEEMVHEQVWEGMAEAGVFWRNNNSEVYIEGGGDGDGGVASLNKNPMGWEGYVRFPNGGPEGTPEPEGLRIPIKCPTVE